MALHAPALLFTLAASAATPPASLYQDPILWRFHPRSRLAIAQLSARAPDALARLRTELGLSLRQTVEVWVLPEESGAEIEAPRWAAGYAQPGRSRITVRQLDAQRALALVQHELVHLMLHQNVRVPLPRWFEEGLALIYGGEWGMEEALRAAAASWNREWLSLDECSVLLHGGDAEKARKAYLESAAFVLHLRSRYGADAPRRLVGAMVRGFSFAESFRRVTGTELATVERAFLGAPKSAWAVSFLRLIGVQLTSAMALLALIAALVFFARQRQRRAQLELEDSLDQSDG
ncbi:MAG TPA: hypothetical protein VGB99_07500 [Acidobacteriota bacterium]